MQPTDSVPPRTPGHGVGAGETPPIAPRLSIVSTLYRSSIYIEEFHRRITAAAEALGEPFELVFVNDGSPDDSLSRALAIAETDPRVVVVDLSRNFGHHMAYMAGLAHVSGERVFLIDVDLEEQPEWLARFAREQTATGADVVFGFQAERKGKLARRWSGALFYRFFNLLSEVTIPINPCTVRLLTRRYAAALLQLRDRNLFLAGNYAWLGFRQIGIPVEKIIRRPGSSYSLWRRFQLLVTAITSFTSEPLRWIFAAGLAISAISGLMGATLLVKKLLDPSRILSGWTSVMLSVWFLGGTLILICGILGIYIGMIFTETKHRPPYIVREVRGGGVRTKEGPAQ